MGSGLIIVESYIGNGIGGIFGNPFYLGLGFLGFFFAFLFLQGSRLDVKVAIGVPVLFLSLMFIPILIIPYSIAISVIVFWALTRGLNK